MDDQRDDGEAEKLEPFEPLEMRRSEDHVHAVDLGDEDLHGKAEHEGDEEHPVLSLEDIDEGVLDVGHADHMEDLGHGKDGEGECLGLLVDVENAGGELDLVESLFRRIGDVVGDPLVSAHLDADVYDDFLAGLIEVGGGGVHAIEESVQGPFPSGVELDFLAVENEGHAGLDVSHMLEDGEEEGDRRDEEDDCAVEQSELEAAVGEDAVLGVSRLLVHDAFFLVVHAQGDGRKGIGDEVDPEDVEGGKRKDDAVLGEGGQDGEEEHDQDFGEVGGKEIEDGLLDVGEDASSFFDGLLDGGEVVVGQDHVRGALGDVGAGDAHGDADVGSLEGRGVVDAVSGHGDDVSVGLEGLDDLNLVLGRDASEDVRGVDFLLESLFVEGVDLIAAHALVDVIGDAEILGDGKGSVLVVAGDHDGTDSGLLESTDGRLGFRPFGIDHADHAFVDEVCLAQSFAAVVETIGEGKDTEGLGSHLGGSPVDGFDVLRGDGTHLSVDVDVFRMLEDGVQGAFGIDDLSAVEHVFRRHHLADGIKGELIDARLTRRLCLFLFDAESIGIVEKGKLGGIAISVAVDGGIGAQHHSRGKEIRGDGLVGIVDDTVLIDLLDGHPVLGQRARLVGADDRDRAESFDGRKLTDDRIDLDHLADAESEGDGDDGRQAFRNGGDGKGDGVFEEFEDVLADLAPIAGGTCLDKGSDDADEEGDDDNDEADEAELFGQDGKLLLQRRFFVLGIGEHVGDLSHLRVHAGSDDDTGAAAVGDRAGHMADRSLVGNESVFSQDGSGIFLGGNGFSGEGGLVRLHVDGSDETDVGRDDDTFFEDDKVTGDEFFRFDVAKLPIPFDGACRTG